MRRVRNALTRRKGVRVFRSALLRREGVRGFGFGIGCSGVIQMTRDGCRQVGIGRIGVGSVTVVTDRVLFAKEKGELAESSRYHSMDCILGVFVKKKLYSPTQLNRTTSPPQDSTDNLDWHWRTAPPLHSTASTKHEVPLSMFFNEVLECTKQACSMVEYR